MLKEPTVHDPGFVKLRTALSAIIVVLLSTITFFAGKTYDRFEKLDEFVRVMAMQVAVHESRLDNLEGLKYAPFNGPIR